MSEPFIAEIKIFAGNFAPRGYAFCNGQLLPIAQNTALFSLIGTTYGGDGRTTCALPNLQDRAPLHAGNGPGLTQRRLGYVGGSASETLNQAQIPSHTHQVRISNDNNRESVPAQNAWGRNIGNNLYRPASDANVTLGSQTIESVGGGQAHNNMQPFLALNFIIALVGMYPSRN